MRKLTACILILIASSFATAGDALLTVTGDIARHANESTDSRIFSDKELLTLPQHTIKTSTAWTPQSRFTGPRLSDVLEKSGARGRLVEVHCLDNYSYTLTLEEIKRYQPILAHSMDGKRLSVSDFGPLFLVYPRDQYPKELRTPMAEAKFGWQINGLKVK